jgi:hypothetical protein
MFFAFLQQVDVSQLFPQSALNLRDTGHVQGNALRRKSLAKAPTASMTVANSFIDHIGQHGLGVYVLLDWKKSTPHDSPLSPRPDVDSDSPNLPIAAEDVPTRLKIQVVTGDLALPAIRIGNVDSIVVGANIHNGYLAEGVGQ